MSEAPSEPANKRPVIITIICILSFVSVLFSIPLALSDFASNIGTWYPPFLIISAVVGFLSFIGFWRMRLWGLYLYVALFIAVQVVMIVMHIWSPLAAIFPIVLITIGFCYRSRMT